MQLQRLLLASVLAGVSAIDVGAQTPRFRTTRPIELHLAEEDAGPGLTPVHVNGEARVIYLHPEIQLDDHDIRSAAVLPDANGRPAVQVYLRRSGVEKFNALVTKNAHKILAIATKDKVVSAPYIEGTPMTDDLLDITGALTGPEAAALVRALSR